ncbi:GntR family transcriptional regulator [Clostridium sp. KNHs216]|jgi:Transcriptional regulators|uniref:GntR family transcriptional regulator n=1 Tax=Eubacteriales TaxID=186802 RepID=UPI00114FE560|nr:GntR family transcriptional regulator [Clostridium sp. KNHs216]MBE6830910.1 GntR family transcriptional regulator [Oscillospiraceae bacterium]TQI66909.1 GntR family transcriptional regulator [Clostridium sp. KNHs216]
MIDKTKPIPLYYQIKEQIKEQIKSGELVPGDKLPTEQWYSQYYGVSRVTVRKTLGELISEGIIERMRGQGPVVSAPKFNRQLGRLTGLHEDLTSSGISATSRILSVKMIQANDVLAERMGIKENEDIISIYRVRYANKQPFAEQKIYLRDRFCHGLDAYQLETNSLLKTLEGTFQLKIAHAEQVIDAVLPTKKQCENLDISDKTPLVRMKRTTFLQNGDAVEYTEIYYVSDRYNFSMKLYR